MEDLTKNIIRKYDFLVPFTDIEKVVNKLSGKVTLSSDLSKIDSYIKKTEIGFEIMVSDKLSTEAKNFVVARHIGDLFIYMGYQTNSKFCQNQNDEPFKENPDQAFEAIRFAYFFLMPKFIFMDVLENKMTNKKVNLTKVAQYFNVSEEAVVIRARQLEYTLES